MQILDSFHWILGKRVAKDKIVSFEPLTIARKKKLLYNASKDNNWFVHEQTAIGDYKGTININISKNSVSSSILPMHNLHSDAEIESNLR